MDALPGGQVKDAEHPRHGGLVNMGSEPESTGFRPGTKMKPWKQDKVTLRCLCVCMCVFCPPAKWMHRSLVG